MSRIEKFIFPRVHLDVSPTFHYARNCCQHFLHEKTTLLKKKFWGLSFEECRMYGMDILRRLHVRGNMKQQRFMTILKINICEMTWYKIVGLLRSTCYTKHIPSEGVDFYLTIPKACINFELQPSKRSQMFNC
jgi:hypothetical protein